MGFFNRYEQEGKGVSKDENTPRFLLFFQLYFRKFWNLISLNFLYVLFCIPIVTIGPATAAFTKILRNYAREEHAFLWGDFIETFKTNFKQAFLFSLIDFAVGAFLAYDAMLCLYNVQEPVIRIMSLAAIMFGATVYVFMHYYIYSMMVTFRLTIRQLIKNAFIFCWVGFIRNLLMTVAIVGLTVFLVFNLNYIYVLFLLLTIYFSTVGFFVNFNVNPVIKKHMIDGYDPETGAKLDDEKYAGFDDEKKGKK